MKSLSDQDAKVYRRGCVTTIVMAVICLAILIFCARCEPITTTYFPSNSNDVKYCDTIIIHDYDGEYKRVLTKDEKCIAEKMLQMKVGQYIWLNREMLSSISFIEKQYDSLRYPKFFNGIREMGDPAQYNFDGSCLKFYRFK